jgi:hypothetical protein
MNSLKRFVLGFAVGIGIMYWYLNHSESSRLGMLSWINGAASQYRGDESNRAAKEVLGDR